MHTLTVVISFPVSAVKAQEVLEAWNVRKDGRKRYMRQWRRGERRGEVVEAVK